MFGSMSIHLDGYLPIWYVRTFYQINYLCHQLEEKIIISKCLPTIELITKKKISMQKSSFSLNSTHLLVCSENYFVQVAVVPF